MSVMTLWQRIIELLHCLWSFYGSSTKPHITKTRGKKKKAFAQEHAKGCMASGKLGLAFKLPCRSMLIGERNDLSIWPLDGYPWPLL